MNNPKARYDEIRRNLKMWNKKKGQLKIPQKVYFAALFDLRRRELEEYLKLHPSPVIVRSEKEYALPHFEKAATPEEVGKKMRSEKHRLKAFIEHNLFSNEEALQIIEKLHKRALDRLNEILEKKK